ncbi:hypothetical protein D3C85_1273290 [compost metagenome]
MLPLLQLRPYTWITARAQVPGQANRAIDVRPISAIVLAEHLFDRLAIEHLPTVEAPLGEQHLHELADIPRRGPQAASRQVANFRVLTALALQVAAGAVGLQAAGADKT